MYSRSGVTSEWHYQSNHLDFRSIRDNQRAFQDFHNVDKGKSQNLLCAPHNPDPSSKWTRTAQGVWDSL